jgi:hypothetical protein
MHEITSEHAKIKDTHIQISAFLWTLLLTSVALSSCQKTVRDNRTKQEKNTSYLGLLTQGRRNVHNTSSTASGLNLLGVTKDAKEVSSTYDEETGALTWISYDTNAMADFEKSDLPGNCLETIDARSADFMVNGKELSRIKDEFTEFPNGQTIVSYSRILSQTLVRDTYVDCVYSQTPTGSFRLREIVNRTGGDIQLANDGEATASFSDVLDEIGTDNLDMMESRELIKRVESDEGIQYLKVKEFTARDRTENELFTISLANGTKQLVEAFPHKVSLTRHNFKASVYTSGYRQGAYQDSAMSFATITGTGGVITLDASGSGDLADTDTSVTVTLTGPRAVVFDIAVSTTNPVAFPTTVSAAAIVIPNTIPQFPAINAFMNIQKVNHFIRRQLPAATSSILTRSVAVGINVVGACNAFFDPGPKQISLFAAGTAGNTSCPNMATMNDVLFHEWGHGLDDSVGRVAGISDGAFSEGIGDIVATYLSNNPKVGQGFFLGTDTEIRTVANTLKVPGDLSPTKEVHDDGRIIGGAFWDLRLGLIQRYGAEAGAYHAEKLFVNHLLNSDAYTESYENVVRLDDNDGNPSTKSPNFCIINSAFAKHGLAVLENACVDVLDGKDIKFNDTIKLGVVGVAGKDAGKLMVSVDKTTAQAQICKGDWRLCVPADKTDIELLPSGKAGDRLIFLSNAAYSITEQEELTIIAKDAYGEIIGVKTVKFVSN